MSRIRSGPVLQGHMEQPTRAQVHHERKDDHHLLGGRSQVEGKIKGATSGPRTEKSSEESLLQITTEHTQT